MFFKKESLFNVKILSTRFCSLFSPFILFRFLNSYSLSFLFSLFSFLFSLFRIITTDPSLVYPVDAFLRSWIFRIISDSVSSLFTVLRSSCSWIFWNFQKNNQEKAWWSLGLLMLQRVVFTTQSNNYNRNFYAKIVNK